MKSWRKTLPVHKAADLLPLMGKSELRELADDIDKHGLRHKIDLYFDANAGKEYVLDGRNRLDALELLGRAVLDDQGKLLSKYHRQTPTNLGSAPDLVAWVISTNIRRRHLNSTQKRELLDRFTKENPDISSRRVAGMVGVSHPTATKSRRRLEAAGDVEKVTTSTDTKGRQQPTKKAAAKPPKPKAQVPDSADNGLAADRWIETSDAVPSTSTPAPNVTKPHDLDARRLLKEIDALDPAKLADPDAFGEALGVRATRFTTFAAKRKAK